MKWRIVSAVLIVLMHAGWARPATEAVQPAFMLYTSDVIFPQSWLDPTIAATATEVMPVEEARSEQIIRVAMQKYPVDLLQQHLTAMHVVRTLKFSVIAAAGTTSLDRLYLANDGLALGYTDTYLENMFHHECSSILLRNQPSLFSKTAW